MALASAFRSRHALRSSAWASGEVEAEFGIAGFRADSSSQVLCGAGHVRAPGEAGFPEVRCCRESAGIAQTLGPPNPRLTKMGLNFFFNAIELAAATQSLLSVSS